MKVLIVGAGLYGSIHAYLFKRLGHNVEVIDRRNHIGGNIYTEKRDNIDVHMYGPHIFHTNDDRIWAWINRFSSFNNFSLRPFSLAKGRLYSLPFNMLTFEQIWGVVTPEEARQAIERNRFTGKIRNLEDQAKSLVGSDIFELLIKGYTEKQWGKDCTLLPASIIRRLPVRYTYDNNYFNDKYQGIPEEGYTQIVNRLLEGVKVSLGYDYVHSMNDDFDIVIYTGPIDMYYNYIFGELEYRSLRWEHESKMVTNFQGMAMMNFADKEVPYTRIIEHKHFNPKPKETSPTWITREFPSDYIKNETEPLYPVNDKKNSSLFQQYKHLALQEEKVHFGGRLGSYKYYNMDQVIGSAFNDFDKSFNSTQVNLYSL